jgi:hypothetical protein
MVRTTRKTPKKNKDFYSEINEEWVMKTRLPSTESRITQAYFVEKHIDEELAKIIHSTKDGPIADLLQSWKKAEDEKIPQGLSTLIQTLQSLKTPSDIIARIGWMNRYKICPPITLYIAGDVRDHSRCRIFIEEGDMQIGIPEYWEYEEYSSIRREYETYCTDLATIVGIPDLIIGYNAEKEVAHLYPSYQERYYKIRRHNVYTWSEIHTKYTGIDWKRLFMEWGLPENKLKDFKYNISSHRFLFHIQHRLQSWSSERWANWLSLIAIQWLAGMSPHGPLRTAWYNFNRKFMQGMPADISRENMRTETIQYFLPQTLGKLWKSMYCTEDLRTDIGKMIVSIKTAAEQLFQHTSWMSSSTIAHAIKKLNYMEIQYCWPTEWNDPERLCGLHHNNYVENILELSSLMTDAGLNAMKEYKCGDRAKYWDRPVYEVNAFYYQEKNMFILPAGILRPPFYDPKKSVAWNYGSIGSTIGHEICHGFDAEGRKYDHNGDLLNWWTEHDVREYKKRERKVVQLYESEEYRGMDVDGHLTLVENIADLGGMEFAIAAMKAHYGKDLKKKHMQEFFISYTVSWRAKDRLKKAKQLLTTDPHAPPRMRVDHVVRQMDAWYDAFDVPADSKHYIPPENRIHFFGY